MQANTSCGSPLRAFGTNDVEWMRADNRIAATHDAGTS
jgi:hypothetical protein